MPLKPWQAWGIDHLSRKPVPAFDHPLGKEVLPDVQSKPPLAQLWTIPTHPVTGYQEESSAPPSPRPLQDAAESCEVAPQPPLLQNRQKQCPHLLLTGHAFQPLHQVLCPPLEALKDLNVLFKWKKKPQNNKKTKSQNTKTKHTNHTYLCFSFTPSQHF